MTWDITGLGAVACVGDTPREIYDSLCAGRSGVAGLRAFDVSKYRAKHAYEIDDRAVPGVDEPLRATRWLRQAVSQALDDAGLPHGDYPVLVGTTLRELRSAELWWRQRAPLTLSDLHFGGALRTGFGTTESHTVASACAASLYTLGMATDLIELGLADTVVAAGTDSITESSYGALDRLQNLTPESVRPFDADRRGMLMGEGAVAVVVRKPETHSGPVHARVRGVSMNCDGAHPTMPNVASIVRAIRESHDRAKVRPDDIDLVITHGSGTRQNDLAEAGALADVFADVALPPLVTAIKSGTGHTCGGSGLLSFVVGVLALQNGAVPPIIGLDDRMEAAANLRLVHGAPTRDDLSTAQIHSIGLGGINAVAIVEKAA